MTRNPFTTPTKSAFLAILTTTLLTACGTLGDTAAVREATDLAVDCRTDEALAAAGRADQSSGVSMHLGGLMRVAILRESGRNAEAAQALADYRAKPEAAKMTDEDIEESVTDFIEGFREERLDETGSADCL